MRAGKARTTVTGAAVIATLTLGLGAGSAAAATPAPCANRDADVRTLPLPVVQKALICEINARRSARGLKKVVSTGKLRKTAESYAARLVAAGRLDHRLGGTDPRTRAKAAGYKHWRTVQENLAMGQRTVVAVVDEWMNDAPHRRNVLLNRKEIGVAYQDGYWVQLMGREPAKKPKKKGKKPGKKR